MMRLLRSWRDSLLLLAPQNFKLFALVTLKSTFETYKALTRDWYWFLFPIFIVIQHLYLRKEAYQAQFMTELSVPYYILIGALYVGFAVWMTVTFCLATRPSIGQKTLRYFDSHRRFGLILALVAIALWLLGFWLNRSFDFYQHEFTSICILKQALIVFILPDFVPLLTFLILFFLDSDGSIQELWTAAVRAVKMVVYNLPLVLILMAAIMLPAFLGFKYAMSHQWSGYMYVGMFLLYIFLLKPLLINLWANIYIKKLHEMPDLYFHQPK